MCILNRLLVRFYDIKIILLLIFILKYLVAVIIFFNIISEKLRRPLLRYVVPVVYGADDVHKVAPPNSYIDVRNFSSPKHLADYLIFLNEHDDDYLSYLMWKKNYQIETGTHSYRSLFCGICKYLFVDRHKKQLDDFTHWFFNESGCKFPDIPLK